MLLTLLRNTGAAGNTLSADRGQYNLTGNVVDFRAAYRMAAAVAVFTLIGSDANAIAGRKIVADKGTFTYTANDATLTKISGGVTLSADRGQFTLTGQAANLLQAKRLQADSRTYVLTGIDAAFTKQSVIQGQNVAYLLTGQDAALFVRDIPVYTFDANVIVTQDTTFEVVVEHEPVSQVTVEHEPITQVTVDHTPTIEVTVTPNFDYYDL